MAEKRIIPPFDDVAVVYFNKEDPAWVAHSLRTDQIGVADSPVDALADLIRGVRNLLAEAQDDPTIAYLREAPDDIQELAKHSKKLPGEIYEVAFWKAMGRWPEGWDLPEPDSDDQSFVADVKEPAPC